MLTDFNTIMNNPSAGKGNVGERNTCIALKTNSPASEIICAQHTVFRLSKSDSKSLSFAPEIPCFNFQI